ncbi:acyl-CoA dehydrogenase family protein [Pendulispora albinea]|uniref:Acyl-CoA/acyl-ACP dehydrogenase n=1 Tax=Pendulispora albinea TaxID=2741071 RepID=A0ABZ2M6Y9_9BACT
MTDPTPAARSELAAKTRTIAHEVAARHAADVDLQARFPTETFEAAKQAKLLSAAVPRELGGAGADLRELTTMCSELAQGCGASGMVLAMHHIQVACIARHGLASPFFRRYLEEVCERQLLIGSVTSEVGVWGDTRSSICALVRHGDRCRLEKDATTASYAEHADDLLVTCRRGPEAAASDQILVLLRKPALALTKTTTWDTLGMRGTCSPGFKVASDLPEEQVVPGSFADASAQTMVSYSHILWSGVWVGIAADAVARASAYVRAEARKKPGTVPPHASRLAEVSVMLQTMRNNTAAMAAEFDAITARPDGMEQLLTIGWALKMNNLKVSASEMAPAIVHQALQIVGINGYKNDSKYSVGRQYRDALSAALMISNDRVLSKNASMLLVYKDE